jgi:hypothetical protein
MAETNITKTNGKGSSFERDKAFVLSMLRTPLTPSQQKLIEVGLINGLIKPRRTEAEMLLVESTATSDK